MAEAQFARQRFCCGSCAKKHENPMRDIAARQKMSETLRRIGHMPKVRGGNGRPTPLPVMKLHAALGDGWLIEYVMKTGVKRGQSRLPFCYKIDIANPSLMIAIEVDGSTHHGERARQRDSGKEMFLAQSGWSLFRVKNAEALKLSTISGSQAILRTLRGEC